MLTTYDRYMRDFRIKLLSEKLKRKDTYEETEVIAGVHVAQVMRQAVKDSMRNMEGHA